MSEEQFENNDLPEKSGLDRREFLSQSLAMMAGAMILGVPGMRKLINVRICSESTGEASPTPTESSQTGLKKVDDYSVLPPPAIAKMFLDEKLRFEITFLGAKTAEGVITFKRTSMLKYTASVEATMTGLVTSVIKHRKQVLTSTFMVKKVNGKERFVSVAFYRKQIRTDGTRESHHEFNYSRNRWTNITIRDGKQVSKRNKRIPKGVFYDDIVNLLYNMRAQVYGTVSKGANFTRLQTMPWSRTITADNGKKKKVTAETVDVHIAADGEISDSDRNWMKQIGGEYMFIVKMDPEVYGIKSGMAKLVADKNLKPVGAKVNDVIGFGDVIVSQKA